MSWISVMSRVWNTTKWSLVIGIAQRKTEMSKLEISHVSSNILHIKAFFRLLGLLHGAEWNLRKRYSYKEFSFCSLNKIHRKNKRNVFSRHEEFWTQEILLQFICAIFKFSPKRINVLYCLCNYICVCVSLNVLYDTITLICSFACLKM